jgi:hypothetical protein
MCGAADRRSQSERSDIVSSTTHVEVPRWAWLLLGHDTEEKGRGVGRSCRCAWSGVVVPFLSPAVTLWPAPSTDRPALRRPRRPSRWRNTALDVRSPATSGSGSCWRLWPAPSTDRPALRRPRRPSRWRNTALDVRSPATSGSGSCWRHWPAPSTDRPALRRPRRPSRWRNAALDIRSPATHAPLGSARLCVPKVSLSLRSRARGVGIPAHGSS